MLNLNPDKMAEKLYTSLSSFGGQSNEYQGFLGAWWLKAIPHCDPVAFKQMNFIHKLANLDK